MKVFSENLKWVVAGIFASDSVESELNGIADAILEGRSLVMDGEGTLFPEDEIPEGTTLSSSNMSKVNSDPFAYNSTEDELNQLGDAFVNGEEIYMDDEGVLYTHQDVDGLTTLNTSNMTKVNNDPFAAAQSPFSQAGIECQEAPQGASAESNESLNEEAFVIGDIMDDVDETVPEEFSDGVTGSLNLDETGAVSESFERHSEEVSDEENSVQGENLTRVTPKPFAAIAKPTNRDQWYNKNETLFKGEVIAMRKKHPKAVLGFFKTTGNMYWIITAKVHKGVEPWTFLLEYEKDHPHNTGYGGSIHVQLLKSPSLADLKARAQAHGRPGVPHTVNDVRHNGEQYVYLCTRFPEDIQPGSDRITSAVQVAGWAADWAAHFELGMINKAVWNKWVDDEHFRWMKI